MNTKRYLVFLTLVALFIGIIALSSVARSIASAAQMQNTSIQTRAATESNLRLMSGPIQFTDGNFPDLRPRIQPFKIQVAPAGCMTEDSTPRRQSGCIE